MRLIRPMTCKQQIGKALEVHGLLLDEEGSIFVSELFVFAFELNNSASKQLSIKKDEIEKALKICASLEVSFTKNWTKRSEFIDLKNLMDLIIEDARKLNSVQRVVALTDLEKTLKSRPFYLEKVMTEEESVSV